VVVAACGAVALPSLQAAEAKTDGAAAPTANASMPISKNWTMEKILSLDRDQIIALWKTLPSVTVAELHGHYMGLVPNAGNAKRQASTTAFMYDENSSRGYWLGKAYKQTGPHKGEGYNRWRFPDGKVVRNLRFSTEDGISLIDGEPALLMNYGAYNKSNLVDELRKLDDYVYLGLGTVLASGGKRGEPGHFVLIGPTDEWVGVDGAK
jgi:hypothetical protein